MRSSRPEPSVVAAEAVRKAPCVSSRQIDCVVGAGEGEAGPACAGPVMGSVESSKAQVGGRAVEGGGAGTVPCPPKAWRSILECRVRECNRNFALPIISACRRQKATSMPPSVFSRKSALRFARWPNSYHDLSASSLPLRPMRIHQGASGSAIGDPCIMS